MILSMTGYGDAEAHEGGISYRVEIRTLNNRYFKAAMKLPETFQLFETEIEKRLRSRLGRGSVTFLLRIRDESATTAYEINQVVLRRYIDQLRAAADGGPGVTIELSRLAELPGVSQPPELEDTLRDNQKALILQVTDRAIDKLVQMRRSEGEALRTDLQRQCDVIRQSIAAIQSRSPFVVKEYHEKLRSRVQELMNAGNYELQADALAREVAIFAERCDVNEELSRTASHLKQFAATFDSPEEAGRKLEFISQEMLREANTIGSKANDAEIARWIIEMKTAIDRIKEQIQNVE